MNTERYTLMGALKEVFENENKMIVLDAVLEDVIEAYEVDDGDDGTTWQFDVARVFNGMLILDVVRIHRDTAGCISFSVQSEDGDISDWDPGFPIGAFALDLQDYPGIVNPRHLVWTREDWEDFIFEKTFNEEEN